MIKRQPPISNGRLKAQRRFPPLGSGIAVRAAGLEGVVQR
jgi:hypothetical protein